MAWTNLRLKEGLRSWERAGLEFILVDHAMRGRIQPFLSGPAETAKPTQNNDSANAWPESWQLLLKSISRPARSVWTYAELGLDMGGRPDAGRRNILLRLTKALARPKGSIAYWPTAVLRNEELCHDLRLFQRGVKIIGAEFVVCFGQALADDLLKALAETSATFPQIIPFPELRALLEDERLFEESLNRLSKLFD